MRKSLITTDEIQKYELVMGGHQGLELYGFQLRVAAMNGI